MNFSWRLSLVLIFLPAFFYCCKKNNVEGPGIEPCDHSLPGFLIVDERQDNSCELIIPLDSSVFSDMGSRTEFSGITLDVDQDGLQDFKIFPGGYVISSGNGYSMTIESLNETFYFATETYEFDYCELYKPQGGFYVDCRTSCNEFQPDEIDEFTDTLSSVRTVTYVAALSAGDLISEQLQWGQQKTHFYKDFNHHVSNKKCYPISKWWPNSYLGKSGIAYHIPIKQLYPDSSLAYGWIKLDYRKSGTEPWYGHTAYIHETYLQQE